MKWSVSLYEGLGNLLFQVSFLFQYCQKHKIERIILKNWHNKLFTQQPFGWHIRTGKRKHLGEVLDGIEYDDTFHVVDRKTYFTYAIQSNEYYDIPPGKFLVNTGPDTEYIVFSGWFFNYRYHTEYRKEFLQTVKFSPKVLVDCPDINYDEAISLHARLGSNGDNGIPDYISPEKYIKALKWLRDKFPTLKTVVISSESKEKFDTFLPFSWFTENDFIPVFIEDDPEVCVAACLKCRHHILANSTLSFMMSFMDPKFPEDSIAICEKFKYLPMMYDSRWEYPDKNRGYIHFDEL